MIVENTHYYSVLSQAMQWLGSSRNHREPPLMISAHHCTRWMITKESEEAAKYHFCWSPRSLLTGQKIMISISFKLCGLCLVHSNPETWWQGILGNAFPRLPVTLIWREQEKKKVHTGGSQKNNMQWSHPFGYSASIWTLLPVFKF